MTPNTRLLAENQSRQFLPVIKIDCVWLCMYDCSILVLIKATLVAVTGTHGMMAEIALADEQREE